MTNKKGVVINSPNLQKLYLRCKITVKVDIASKGYKQYNLVYKGMK